MPSEARGVVEGGGCQDAAQAVPAAVLGGGTRGTRASETCLDLEPEPGREGAVVVQ